MISPNRNNLSANTFSIEAPQNLLKQKEYSKNISSGKEFPLKSGSKLLRTFFGCLYRNGVAIHAYPTQVIGLRSSPGLARSSPGVARSSPDPRPILAWTHVKQSSSNMSGFPCQDGQKIRQILLVSVKFVSATLGPETAAPILWTPGKMRSFCRKNHVHKIPRFRGGGGILGFWGGGGVPILFLWARGFF